MVSLLLILDSHSSFPPFSPTLPTSPVYLAPELCIHARLHTRAQKAAARSIGSVAAQQGGEVQSVLTDAGGESSPVS